MVKIAYSGFYNIAILHTNVNVLVGLPNNLLAPTTKIEHLYVLFLGGQVASCINPQSGYQHNDNNKLYIFLMNAISVNEF